MLTGTSEEDVSSRIVYQDPTATYKVTEISGWSWTYNASSSLTKDSSDIEDNCIEFPFEKTKSPGVTVKNAERAVDNLFTN